MSDSHFADALPILGGVLGLGSAVLILHYAQPSWSAQLVIGGVIFALLITSIWLPLFLKDDIVRIIVITMGGCFFGVCVGIGINDREHWWLYLAGAILFFIQGIIASTKFWTQQMATPPIEDESIPQGTEE